MLKRFMRLDPPGGRCRDCAFFAGDRSALEAGVPGLASMGSAYGATLGESRLCARFDRFVSPGDGCASITPVLKRGVTG